MSIDPELVDHAVSNVAALTTDEFYEACEHTGLQIHEELVK